MTDTSPWRHAIAWCTAALLFALANALTLGNPGYFSHDELQWGVAAAVDGIAALPFVGLAEVATFQYRPLTFDLWLLLSHALFERPALFHQVHAAVGFGVCALLYASLRRAGATRTLSLVAAAAFALNPYAIYVHGWVATLGDLLWTAAALAIAWRTLAAAPTAWRAPALFALVSTALGLLAKESALAIPALLALASLLTREARWRGALLGSAIPTLAYLALRLPILLHAPRPGGAYAWSIENIPLRVAEFHVWPLVPTVLEMTSLHLANPLRLAAIAGVALALLVAVAIANRRLGVLLCAGTAIALGPTIVLATNYPQYGYGASALACACIALAWSRMAWTGRAAVLLVALLSTWHGVNVQREMRRVGEIESVFSPALDPLIRADGAPLVLVPDVRADIWIYQRLALSLPQARRAVAVNASGEGLRIAADGRLPAAPSP